MEKKKLYIFFTIALQSIGGAELYTAGKVEYLKKNGWEVQVYSWLPAPIGVKAAIPMFDEYIQKGNGALDFLLTPPYKFKSYEREGFLTVLLTKINVTNPEDYEIIVESLDATDNFWAELVASRLGARHFVVMLHEGYANIYRENLDFFYFKLKRNELIASKKGIERVFNGYKNVTKTLYELPPTVREADPIKDVPFQAKKIARLDWNICHIGRITKPYVPAVIEGVAQLAKRHPNEEINFIFVGNTEKKKDLIKKTFDKINNVTITELGDMVPIPRSLLSKVDVVCAISQSARFAANEGILTIVGNADTPDKTPGVLGYDTEFQVSGEGTFSYVEALENVLVKKIYRNKKYSLPKLKPADEYYKDFWTIVKNADPKKEYYVERLSEERIRPWTATFPFGVIAKGARIVLFGENKIAQDYRDQIESQSNIGLEFGEGYIKNSIPKPYCTIVATVDEHPENFDNDVVGIERLQQRDYDAIVITAFSQQAQAAYDKIIQTVPDMVSRIVYHFQVIYT